MSLEDLSPQEREAMALGKRLMANPEIRLNALRLAKQADPNLRSPELEIDERITKERNDSLDREQKLEAKLMEERVARRKMERDSEIKNLGYEPADIEKIIVEEKCSYETALKLAAAERRAAEPGPGDVRSGAVPHQPIDHRPDKDWRKLDVSGLRKKSSEIARGLIDEMRGRRAAS